MEMQPTLKFDSGITSITVAISGGGGGGGISGINVHSSIHLE